MNITADLTLDFYVPLIEILYEDNIRFPINFLKTKDGLCRKLEQLYFEKMDKKTKKSKQTILFVPYFGNLKIQILYDNYNYYRSTRIHVCDKEPIRPLVGFSSNFTPVL